MSESWLFDVTDVKQYACCPRLVYYHTCLPDVRPLTYTMQAGIQSHQQEDEREHRRIDLPATKTRQIRITYDGKLSVSSLDRFPPTRTKMRCLFPAC
jgi:hypothetical protein